MRNSRIFAVLLGISALCGCSDKDYGKIEDIMYVEIDNDAVKEGYYLSDSGDGSYYLIKDGKLTLVGYDWEKDYRSREPIDGVSETEKGTSEYEEQIRREVEQAVEDYTDKPFTVVRYYNYPENFPCLRLVIEPSRDEIQKRIASDTFYSGDLEIAMMDENTIGTESPYYIYCGTELPEGE